MAPHVHDAPKVLNHRTQMQLRLFLHQHWKGLLVALVVALFGVFIALRWSRDAAETRALLRMPDAERKVLYERTLRSTESLCAQAGTDPALVDRCESSAQFLLAFPECDDACRELARAHWRGPTR